MEFASDSKPFPFLQTAWQLDHTLALGSPFPDLYVGGSGQNLCVSSLYTEGHLISYLPKVTNRSSLRPGTVSVSSLLNSLLQAQ